MYTAMRSLGAALAALVVRVGASASPVVTDVTLNIQFGTTLISVTNSGTVDVNGNTLTVPAGLVVLPAGTSIPVVGSTIITQLTVPQLSNAFGTFSLGGVTVQAPGEVCPVGGPALGVACNAGGGIGGAMGLVGTINVHVGGSVVVPVVFTTIFAGMGGATNAAHVADAALWTTRTGRVHTTLGVVSTFGAGVIPVNLVSPTFLLIGGSFPPGSPMSMSLTFSNVSFSVPEPAHLSILVAAALGLALVAWRRPDRAPRDDRQPSVPASSTSEADELRARA